MNDDVGERELLEYDKVRIVLDKYERYESTITILSLSVAFLLFIIFIMATGPVNPMEIY